jgi:hypothetical protein
MPRDKAEADKQAKKFEEIELQRRKRKGRRAMLDAYATQVLNKQSEQKEDQQ